MTVNVKICGVTTIEAAKTVSKLGAEYVGFVFYPASPRNISPKQATNLAKHLNQAIKKVAVVVDPSNAELDRIFKKFTPDYIQLHGDESIERINDIYIKYGIPVIKAIKIRSSDDVAKAFSYAPYVDMLLFDAKAPSNSLPGGNGLVFDWTLLQQRNFKTKWFLSGGLNIENIQDAIKISGAEMVDVSSSLESAPGIKDAELITFFMQKVKEYEFV